MLLLQQPRALAAVLRRTLPLAGLLASSAWGCADDTDDVDDAGHADAALADASRGDLDGSIPVAPDAGAGCRTFVSDSLIEHACFHELMGPHLERTAGASASASGIEVDRAHTSFRVRLPARPGGGFGGVLTYQARFAGEYALFTRDGALAVSQQGAPVEARLAHPTEICQVLPSVAVYPLRAQTYTIELQSDRPEVVLVIEFMSEGSIEDAYRFECDGRPRPAQDAGTLDAGPLDAAQPEADDASAGASEAGVPDEGGMCRVDPVLEHSCLHAQHGPFADVTAAPAATGPDVSRVHTAYRLSLPSGGPGTVSFRPNMDGEYVFYLDRALPLSVRSEAGSLAPAYSEPVTTCDAISEARVYGLSRGARHDVELGPVAGDLVTLIIESVQALTANPWSSRFEACP